MRLAIVGAVLVLGWCLAAPAHASPPGRSYQGVASAGFGMRANQGSVLVGGFRFVVMAGLFTPSVDVVVSLDRQIGPDNRIHDGELDAHWSEWVASARAGNRYPLAKGLWLFLTGGVALVHARVSGPLDMDQRPIVANRTTLGAEAAAALTWHSEALLITVTAGVTGVPFPQRIEVRQARYELPARIEPWGGLGIGFTY